MTRNQSIDLVKIIAMIMVVRMHIGLNHNLEHFAPFSFIHGIISPAVPLFFMVSGYWAFAEMHPMLRIVIILAALFGCMIIDQIRQWPIVPLTDKLWNKITLKYENRKDNSMLP